MIDQHGASLLREELQPGERIIWSGQPNPSILFTKADIFLIPFTFLWFSFVLPLISQIFSPNQIEAFPFLLFPIFFLVIGFYISIGRFFYKYFKKKKTYYAVTDKRIIVISDLFGKQTQALYIKDIPTINKLINTKGAGSLIFGSQNFQMSMYSNTGMDLFGSAYNNTVPAFFDISDAETVYRKINELKKP